MPCLWDYKRSCFVDNLIKKEGLKRKGSLQLSGQNLVRNHGLRHCQDTGKEQKQSKFVLNFGGTGDKG
jgi:hypothetical protein